MGDREQPPHRLHSFPAHQNPLRHRGDQSGHAPVKPAMLLRGDHVRGHVSRDADQPATINVLWYATAPYLAVDSELGLGRMMDLGQSVISVSSSDISTFTMPTTGSGRAQISGWCS